MNDSMRWQAAEAEIGHVLALLKSPPPADPDRHRRQMANCAKRLEKVAGILWGIDGQA